MLWLSALDDHDFSNFSGPKYGIKAFRGTIRSSFGAFSSTEAYMTSSMSSYNSVQTPSGLGLSSVFVVA